MNKRRLVNLRLFACIFASLILGIAFSVNWILGLVFFFILSFACIFLLYNTDKRYIIAFVIVSYLVGFVYSCLLVHITNNRHTYDGVGYMEGRVLPESKHDIDGMTDGVLVLEDVMYDDAKLDGKVVVYIETPSVVKIGDRVRFYGVLTNKDVYIKSLGDSMAYNDGIRYTATAGRIDERIEGKLDFRENLVFNTNKVLLKSTDPDTAGFLLGMMFGDTSSMQANTRIASKRLGTAHLFAVSGLHVGMIVGFLVAILNYFRVSKRYHLIILPFLFVYAYICGFSVSVIRASIMVTIYLVSNALFLRYDMLSSISLAGTIILLMCPLHLFDVSFVMSFLAVLSISLFSDRFMRIFTRRSDRFKALKMTLSANLSVNIGLLPIMLHLFGGVSLITIPANVIIIPIVTLIFPIFYILFLLIMAVNLFVVVPYVVMPFKWLVSLSMLMQSVDLGGLHFEVSGYFVIAYVIVMILASKLVFIDRRIQLVPKIALVLVVVISILLPNIRLATFGRHVQLDRMGFGYTAVYKDEKNRNVLCIMGDIDSTALDRAVRNIDRHGIHDIYMLAIPSMKAEDARMVEYYNRNIGAKYLLTSDYVDIEGLEVITGGDNMRVIDGGYLSIIDGNVNIMLANPVSMFIEQDAYDLVVTNNKFVDEETITSKYYINFSKVSPSQSSTDFTFYIKNGKITLSK